MTVLQALVAIGLTWLAFWSITTLIPGIPEAGRRVLLVICVVVSVLIALTLFGLISIPPLRLAGAETGAASIINEQASPGQ